MSILKAILTKSSSSEDTLNGKEMLTRDSADDHVLNLNWNLQNFSSLPKYLCSNNYSMALGCRLMWRIEIAFTCSDLFEKVLNLSAKLHRVDCEVGTVRAKFRILLQDNKDELLYESLCCSVFSSETFISPSCMSVKLKDNNFGNLPDDELNLRVVLETDDCCSEDNPTQHNYICFSSKNNPSLQMTTLTEDMEAAYVIGEMADVFLKAGENSIPAHKFVLCARSPVLRKVLESDVRTIIHCDLDPTGEFAIAWRPFVYYLYTGLLDDMSTDVACSLYSMASKYEVRPLQMVCGHLLLSKINTGNVCKILSLAHLWKDMFLKDSAVRFIYTHFNDVAKSDDWQRFIERNSILHSEVLGFCAPQASLKL